MNRLLWLAYAALATASALYAQEQRVQSAVPALPSATSLAGNLIHEGRWYAFGSNEIACVNKLLAGKAMPDINELVQLPPPNNKIILWGNDGGHLKATDVINFDDNAYFLWSERKVHYYNDPDSEARKLLVELIHRIQKGTEQSLAVEKPRLPSP